MKGLGIDSSTLALISPKAKTLQTRKSFQGIPSTSALGELQITDPEGKYVLTQDIDFGATGVEEVFQNVKYILLTEYFSVPLDREFGMDFSMVDKPIPVAEAMLSQEVAIKIALYEPRCQFTQIAFDGKAIEGKLSPNVTITILSTDELPSRYPSSVTVTPTAPPVTVAIPTPDIFWETLIDIAKVPGPIGPPGPPGQDGSIGVDGKQGINAFTTLAANFTVPPVGQTIDVMVVESGWVVVGQIVYVQGASGSGQAGAMKVYGKNGNLLTLLNIAITGTGGGGSIAMIWGETPTGNIDGLNKVYICGYPYQSNSLAVFLNGSRQRRMQDYNETGSQSFSFVNPPLAGDSLSIDYNKS